MAVLPLTQGKDNEILRTVSKPVKKIDKKLRKLISDMNETMFDANGVGLAAPQVGINIRLALVRLNPDSKHETVIAIINPEILNPSKKMVDMEEGCLSLPGQWGSTPRHESLTVTFQDIKGETQSLFLKGFNARIIQHEVGHLNGELYIDHAHEVHEG